MYSRSWQKGNTYSICREKRGSAHKKNKQSTSVREYWKKKKKEADIAQPRGRKEIHKKKRKKHKTCQRKQPLQRVLHRTPLRIPASHPTHPYGPRPRISSMIISRSSWNCSSSRSVRKSAR